MVYPVSWTVTLLFDAAALGIYLIYKKHNDKIRLKSTASLTK